MKIIGGAFLAASLFVAAPAAAQGQTDEAAKLAEAHAIIAIMFPPAQREQTIDKMLAQTTKQFRVAIPAVAFTDPGLKTIVEGYLSRMLPQQRAVLQQHMPEIFEATAVAYTHQFSLAELKDIHAFGRTPSGSHYFSASPSLIADPTVAKSNQELITQISALNNKMLPDLMNDLIVYLKAHPDVAAKVDAERSAGAH